MERLRQSSGANSMDVGEVELESALGEMHWLSLSFPLEALEERYATYRVRCARLLGATPWLTRAGIVVVRAASAAGGGASRGASWGPATVAMSGAFGVVALVLYGVARSLELRDGDGSRVAWTRLAVGLAFAHAAQVVVAYALELGADDWSRPYYLGLDVAVDGGLFALCFGLRLPGVVAALGMDLVALVCCLLVDAHARLLPLASGLVLFVAFAMVARASERQSRFAFAQAVRVDAKQSADMRGISNPFSANNLAAWLFPRDDDERPAPNNTLASPSRDPAAPQPWSWHTITLVRRCLR